MENAWFVFNAWRILAGIFVPEALLGTNSPLEGSYIGSSWRS
jgi:hypothetical protein